MPEVARSFASALGRGAAQWCHAESLAVESNHALQAHETRAAARASVGVAVLCVGDPGLEPGAHEAAGLRPAGRPVVHVTLGVTDRSRTDTAGVTTRCSAIELQPPCSSEVLPPRTHGL